MFDRRGCVDTLAHPLMIVVGLLVNYVNVKSISDIMIELQ